MEASSSKSRSQKSKDKAEKQGDMSSQSQPARSITEPAQLAPVAEDDDLCVSDHDEGEQDISQANSIMQMFSDGSAGLQTFIGGFIERIARSEKQLRDSNAQVSRLQAEVQLLRSQLERERQSSNGGTVTALKTKFNDLNDEFKEEQTKTQALTKYAAEAQPRNAKLSEDRTAHAKKLTKLTDDVRVLLDRTQAWVQRANGIEAYQDRMKDDLEQLMKTVDELVARQQQLSDMVEQHESDKLEQEAQIEELRKIFSILQKRTQSWADASDAAESARRKEDEEMASAADKMKKIVSKRKERDQGKAPASPQTSSASPSSPFASVKKPLPTPPTS